MTISEKYSKVVDLAQKVGRAVNEWRTALIDERQESMRHLFTLLDTDEQRMYAHIALRHAYQLGEDLAARGASFVNFDPVPKDIEAPHA